MAYNIRGTGIIVKEHDNINQALKKFKRKVDDSGKLEALRKKEYYEKPTSRRKREAGAARARHLKAKEKELAALQPPKTR
jgi:small subunit ribosomal protein S21